jgi:hypothetical protein
VTGTRRPLPGSGGRGGTGTPPGAQSGAEGVGHRPLEGAGQAAHTGALARALAEVWREGRMFGPRGELDWLVFAHEVELKLSWPDGGEPGPAAPFTGPGGRE